jgi:membrane-associated phospholipid phosphatase
LSWRAKRSNLSDLRDCFVALLLAMTSIAAYSQDTINFKAFDSLKTSAEDNHKGITDTIAIEKERKTIWIDVAGTNNDPDNWDVRLFRTINNARSPFKDRFFDTFDRSMLPMSFLLPASLFIYGRAYKKSYEENTAYLLTGAQITNFTVTFGLKFFIDRERPLNALANCYCKDKPVLDVYSFPSGHTSTGFSIATMFALRYPSYPQVYAPMYAWALLVAYGRPYFGMHYPSDLLAGAVIGTGSSILIHSLRKELLSFKNAVLTESKKDEGSINAGVVSFFAGSFIASTIVNNFILKPLPGKRLFISPWMDDKRSGVNINYKF